MPFEFKIQNFVRLTAEYFFYKDLSLHTAINTSSARIVQESTGFEDELIHTYFISPGLGYRFSF